MFVPLPIVIVIGLIVLAMIVVIIRLSRRRDPLLGDAPPAFRSPPPVRTGATVAPTTTLPPEVELQVRALVDGGRTIEAIKLVRDVTRLGLKESKELVESL